MQARNDNTETNKIKKKIEIKIRRFDIVRNSICCKWIQNLTSNLYDRISMQIKVRLNNNFQS